MKEDLKMKFYHQRTKKLCFSAIFLALTYVLPFLTGQVPEIGSMLCPMHIPVLLCGFICGRSYGLVVGFMAPLLRSVALGMPIMFPQAVCMALELAAYGMISGTMHRILPNKKPYIYCSLLIAMASGRAVWGVAMFLCTQLAGNSFGIEAFVAAAFTNAVPGIILQIVLVPAIVVLCEQINIFKIKK